MRPLLIVIAILVVLGIAFMFTTKEEEGPAETAGKKIDRMVEETKEDLRQAKENIEEKIDPQGPAEKAGEKIDEAVEEVKEEARQAKENVEDAVKK